MVQGSSTSNRISSTSTSDISASRPSNTVNVPIPSTSAQLTPPTTIEETSTYNNTIINIPTTNPVSSSSSNMSAPGISMTCHNCTINYK
jgi:hypothetical protein